MTNLPDTKAIKLELNNEWLTISLNQPEKRNALTEELSAEIKKCNIGFSKIMGNLSCTDLNAEKVAFHIGDFTGAVLNFKNPYYDQGMREYAVGVSKRWVNGGVGLQYTGNTIMLKTCTTISCPSEDQIYSEVIIE